MTGPVRPSDTPRGAVLVVDDEETVRTALAILLEGTGYPVIEARDGHEAFGHLLSGGIDLIVLDLEMPRMSGWTFRRLQLENSDYASIPTIVLTGIDVGEAD